MDEVNCREYQFLVRRAFDATSLSFVTLVEARVMNISPRRSLKEDAPRAFYEKPIFGPR